MPGWVPKLICHRGKVCYFSLMLSISPLRKSNGVADKTQAAGRLPLSGQMVWVQCKGYRCLAYRDPRGKWVNFYSGDRLTNFIKVVG